MKQIPECFETTPTVYAVGRNYQIIIPVTKETLMWAEIGGKRFYDDVSSSASVACFKISPLPLVSSVQRYRV